MNNVNINITESKYTITVEVEGRKYQRVMKKNVVGAHAMKTIFPDIDEVKACMADEEELSTGLQDIDQAAFDIMDSLGGD